MSAVLIFGAVNAASVVWKNHTTSHDSDVTATVTMVLSFAAMLVASLAQPDGGIGPAAAVLAAAAMCAGTYVSARSQHH